MTGWKFFPDPEPVPPGGYRQARWTRPYRPGPVRVAAAVGLGVLAAMLGAVGILAGLSQGDLAARGIGVVGACVGAGTLAWLAGRVFAAGTWVTDQAVRELGVVTHRVWPWTAVVGVDRVDGARPLGLPVRGPGATVMLRLSDGTAVRTAVTSASPDFIGRPEAFDMAAGAIRRWWFECR